MQVQAILFDFDGTLADTMQNHYLCWKQSLEEFGVMIKAKDYYPMEEPRFLESLRSSLVQKSKVL